VPARPARRLLAGLVAAYGLAVAGTTLAVALRARARYVLYLPPVFATMHLAWGAGFWLGLARAATRRRRRRPDPAMSPP
jgi:hypothetical protein